MSLPEYELIRSDRRTLAIEIRGTRVIVRAPMRTSQREIDTFVSSHADWLEKHLARASALPAAEPLTAGELRALAERALDYIPARVAYYAPLVGVGYGRVTIRNQRTKWGSCSSQGNLNFNCLLMLTDTDIIDSVVAHEICHLKHMNHSKAFYDDLLKLYPEYNRCRKWLKENGPAIMARNPN